jgi:transcription elongation factor GreB
MSKAFTKETDAEIDCLAGSRADVSLGAANYVTPGGVRRWREELKRLKEEDRPRLVEEKEHDPEARQQLRRLDARARELADRIGSAQIVEAPATRREEVQFGATVTVRDRAAGEEEQYRIVGVEEVDLAKGWVSWASPIARALMGARAGEEVTLETPAGERVLALLRVEYEIL